MKKIVNINSVDYGSTGTIVKAINKLANESGFESCYFIKKWRNDDSKNTYGFFLDNAFHKVIGEFSGRNGSFSILSTFLLIRKMKKMKPDIIHLYNIHDFNINLALLFKYVRKNNIQVIWTLFDCWSFTGKCTHFDRVKCNKWTSGCGNCPVLDEYPKSKLDYSKGLWKKKKRLYSDYENLTIVSVSNWIDNCVKQSFLKGCKSVIIKNGIDINVFKPIESTFRVDNNISDNTFIILGVAMPWTDKKGLDVFIKLASILDERFKIVLVGVKPEQKELLPKEILALEPTRNANELAKIYTAADVFLNPTREDTYPTTNMEAIACGTPVITFDTGGSSETVNKYTGFVLKTQDISEIVDILESVQKDNVFLKNEAQFNEMAHSFDKEKRFKEYIDLYENITRITK